MKKLYLVLIFFSLLFLVVQPALTQASVIQIEPTRHFVTGAENTLDITLYYTFSSNVAGLIVTEIVPKEFEFVTSNSVPPSDAIKTNETANEIKWLFINLEGKSELIIQYTLEIPANFNENAYIITGNWDAVGTNTETSGTAPETPLTFSKEFISDGESVDSTSSTQEKETADPTTTTQKDDFTGEPTELTHESELETFNMPIYLIGGVGAVSAVVVVSVILARRRNISRDG